MARLWGNRRYIKSNRLPTLDLNIQLPQIDHIPNGYFIVSLTSHDTASIKYLSQLLLSSTVWFDALDGKSFVSYDNDGLTHPALQSLGMVVKTYYINSIVDY